MATSQPKKVVQSTAAPVETDSDWKPRPEDRAKANKFRWIAVAFWVVAIVIECVVIFGLLMNPGATQTPDGGDPVTVYPFLGASLSQTALWILVLVLIVVCGILAVIGSQFWKKANRLDPTSEKNKFRFFVQNQLGAIISMIAFLPLVIMVLLSKNLKGSQKGVAAGVAIVVLLGSVLAGTEFNPVSVEQNSTEQALVLAYTQAVTGTGTDVVFWVKGSKVYHLCDDTGVLNRNSQDPFIYSGTVGQAKGAGMQRLSLQKECDFDPATVTFTGDRGNAKAGQVLTIATTTEPTPTDSPS